MKQGQILSTILFILLLNVSLGYSQVLSESYHFKDRIILASNQVLFGQITHYDQDTITLELKSGNEIKLLQLQIKSVAQYVPKQEKIASPGTSIHKFSIGNGIMISPGNEENRSSTGLEIAIQYRYYNKNRHVLLAGIGIDFFNLNLPFYHLPVLIGYEYHLPLSPGTSFFGSIRTGYTFVRFLHRQDRGPYQAGLHVSPALGVLFNKYENIGFILEAGMKFQEANHRFEQSWWRILEPNEIHQRYVLRMGIIF